MMVALLVTCVESPSAQEFAVDGDPGEWTDRDPVYKDGRDLAEDSDMLGFDMDAVYTAVQNDRRYVYIRLLDDWPFTTGAGAISWKFIVDTNDDGAQEFRLHKSGGWLLYLPDGDDVFAHRHRISQIEYRRAGTTAEFSFPATMEPLHAAHPSFSFTSSNFHWIITTNAQQAEIDGISYFAIEP